MRVLVVLPFAPWPVRVRCSNLWPRVAREADVHVVALDADLPRGLQATALASVASLELIPFSSARAALRAAGALAVGGSPRVAWNADPGARRAVEAAYRRIRPDVVYAERLRAVPLIETLPPERVVLDPTDSLPLFCEEVQKQRGAPLRQRLLSVIERHRLAAFERAHYSRFARVVACSPRDADAMARTARGARIVIIPNGVDLDRFSCAPLQRNGRPKVLMSGNFGYWPNREAAGWMLRQAPQVRARLGGELVFAGANPPTWLRRADRQGMVKAVGFVPDLAVHYHASAAVAAPVQFAVGSQNKVLEAMACGRPVVTTPQCAAGLEPAGRRSLVAAPREGFVDALGDLLAGEERQRSLAEAGRTYVEQYHDWDEIASSMVSVLAEVATQAA